jgi:hypothetical protein
MAKQYSHHPCGLPASVRTRGFNDELVGIMLERPAVEIAVNFHALESRFLEEPADVRRVKVSELESKNVSPSEISVRSILFGLDECLKLLMNGVIPCGLGTEDVAILRRAIPRDATCIPATDGRR